MNNADTCTLVKLLSMFPCSNLIHIYDTGNEVTLHYGRICDLNRDNKIATIYPDKFVLDSFNVVHD